MGCPATIASMLETNWCCRCSLHVSSTTNLDFIYGYFSSWTRTVLYLTLCWIFPLACWALRAGLTNLDDATHFEFFQLLRGSLLKVALIGRWCLECFAIGFEDLSGFGIKRFGALIWMEIMIWVGLGRGNTVWTHESFDGSTLTCF